MRRAAQLILLAAAVATAWTATQAAPLDEMRWHNRVLVVFGDGAEIDRQLDPLLARTSDLSERKLLVLAVGRDTRVAYGKPVARLPKAEALRAGFGVRSAEVFQAVLVGLDGGVKWRSVAVVDPDRIFEVIDAMPMRRAER